MSALIAAVLLAVTPSPVPATAELAKAEAEVQEVFGRELTTARKPADKAAMARKMIDTAKGSRPAARYALFTRARDLAIAAKDSAVGVEAVEGLAGFAGPSDAAEGHRLWNEARDLAGRLAAAEVYLRALPSLAGFERSAVEKRLRELGWGIRSPEDVKRLFALGSGWKVQDGALVGHAGDATKPEEREHLKIPILADRVEFGFKIKAPSYHVIILEIDGVPYWCSMGHWGNNGLAVCRGKYPVVFKKTGYRVEHPENWYTMQVSIADRVVTFRHAGQVTWSGKLDHAGPYRLSPGFASHDQKVEIKEVYWR